MNYLSICSGIESATVAWHPLKWKPVGFSEIERFPSAVLAHHYPDIPNLGDMTKHKDWSFNERIDLLVGGTPCQAFSVAGARRSLDDERGNLTLTFCHIANQFNPRFVLWENVPGVLNTKDNAFGCLLAGLAGFDEMLKSADGKWRGSGMVIGRRRRVAWITLDAQFAGVPQRRRRIFVLAVDAQAVADSPELCPSKILAIGQSLRRDTPSRGEKRETVAAGASTSLGNSCFGIDGEQNAPEELMGTLRSLQSGGFEGARVATGFHTTGAGYWQEGVGTLRAREQDSHENLLCMAHGQGNAEIRSDGSPSLTCNHEAPIVAFGLPGNWIGRKPENGGNAVEPMLDLSPCQTKTDVHAVCFAENSRAEVRLEGGDGSRSGGNLPLCQTPPKMQVRRLTPEECEALQGFPRGYTNIPWRKKPESPDGPRYKSLGNSMAVPVMRWIGERIDEAVRK